MVNEIIYKGLVLTSKKGCNYYKVVEGNTISLIEDTVTSTMTLTYTPGCTSETIANFLGVSRLGKSQDMEPTSGSCRFTSVYVTLNGLKLQKLTADTHIVSIIIVKDSESRVVQSYDSTTLVISEEDMYNEDLVNFIFYSGNLTYLRPAGSKPKCWSFKNFPKVTIKNSDVVLESESEYVYTLRRRYDDYVIREVEYMDQFILELRRILSNYGVELVRLNKEETLKSTSYVTYQISQTPTRSHHPNYKDEEAGVVQCRLPIDFIFRTPDMVMFYDFKTKYNNLDLITNLTEFKTMDRYGDKWSAAVKWQQITEEFNHLYQTDDNANFANQCQFRCEIYFNEMLDSRYKFLKTILYKLEAADNEKEDSAGVTINSAKIK